MLTQARGFASLAQVLPYWPSHLIGAPAALDNIGLSDFTIDEADDLLRMSGTLLWFGDIEMAIPGLPGCSLVLPGEGGVTAVPVALALAPQFALTLPDITLALRIHSDLLQPVRLADGRWVPILDGAGHPVPLELRLEHAALSVDADGDASLSFAPGGPALTLPEVLIGQTGLVLSADGIGLHFSRKDPPPPGAPAGFRGLSLDSARLYLPPDLDVPIAPETLVLEHMLIGTGGVSGDISAHWTPAYDENQHTFTGPGSGTVLGIPIGLRELELSLRQNVPTGSRLDAELLLPYLDHPVGVRLGLGVDGGFQATLLAESADGIVTIDKAGIGRFGLDRLDLEVSAGTTEVRLGGQVQPYLGGLDWPALRFADLRIDSHGRVRIGGGWLDLPQRYSVDFHAFTLELSQIGFGNDQDGGRWIGFSGGVHLVDGIPAGASVEGLRITWYDDGRSTRVTLNGVGVEFEVPDVLRFAGAVSYREFPDPVTGEPVHRFAGAVKVRLLPLNLEVDGSLVIGAAGTGSDRYGFAGVYLDLELPAGIPLGSTGLSLYGMAGLTAVSMEPNRKTDEDWYEGWYRRSPTGVTDIADGGKWRNQRGSFAFGAGVTIGTGSDNGHLFSGRFLLLIVLPGPVIMLDGRANLLKERAKLDAGEPLLRSLAVLDARAGTLTMGLDARYRYGEQGEVVDVQGSSHAFFDVNDPNAWYLDIGRKEPVSNRVRATLFRLFDASSYLMLNADGVQMGARVEYRPKPWKAGPLKASIEAWLDTSVAISPKPVHFSGEVWLHGSASLTAFGYGVGLSADARLAAEVFDPYHILGSLKAKLNLPWPLHDIGFTFHLEWGPQPAVPPIPVPLKEVAIEHFKSTTSWPLATGKLVLPAVDRGDGFLSDEPVTVPGATTPPPENLPVVPLDARPHLTFGRPMHDPAAVGFNAAPQSPEWERVGDPARGEGPLAVRYELVGVALERWTGDTWVPVAAQGTGETTATPLFGSWALVPRLPRGDGENPGNTKLWLWSKTPFDYNRWTSRGMQEWVISRLPDYPCGLLTPRTWDFRDFAPKCYGPSLTYPDGGPAFFTDDAEGLVIEDIPGPSGTPVRALRFPFFGYGRITLPEPTTVVRLRMPYLPLEYTSLLGYLSEPADPASAATGMLAGDDLSTVEVRAVDTLIGTVGITSAPLGTRIRIADNLSGVGDCDSDGRYLFVPESGTGVIRRGLLGWLPAHWADPMPPTDPADPQSIMLTVGTGYQNPRQVRYLPSGLLYVLEAGNGGNVVRCAVGDPPVAGQADRSGGLVVASGLPGPGQLAFDHLDDGTPNTGVAYLVGTRDQGGYLAQLDLSGAGTPPVYLPVTLNGPVGLAGGRPRSVPGHPAMNLSGAFIMDIQPPGKNGSVLLRLWPRLDGDQVVFDLVNVGDREWIAPSTLHHDGEEAYLFDWGWAEAFHDDDWDPYATMSPRVLAWAFATPTATGVLRVGYGATGAPRLIAWGDGAIDLVDLPPVIGPATGAFNEASRRTLDESWDLRFYDAPRDRYLAVDYPVPTGTVSAVTFGDAGPVRQTLVTSFPPVGHLAVDPAGEFLYAGVQSDPHHYAVVRVDLRNGPVDYHDAGAVVTIMGPNVSDNEDVGTIVLDPTGSILYVVTNTQEGGSARIWRIDLADASFPTTSVWGGGRCGVDGLIIDRDGKRGYVLYAPWNGGTHLMEVDLDTGAATEVGQPQSLGSASWTPLVWTDEATDRLVMVGERDVSRMELGTLRGRTGMFLQAYRQGGRTRPAIPRKPSYQSIFGDVSFVAVLPGGRVLASSIRTVPAGSPAPDPALTGAGVRVFTFPHVYLESLTDVGGAVVRQRFEEVLDAWSGEGQVLQPDTTYRLKIVTRVQARGMGEISGYSLDRDLTQYAFFRTGGPPALAALTVPEGTAAGADYRSGLEDLTRYVARTVPDADTGPSSAWYAANDVTVEFNENYVELMYRLAWRGLDLQLYDNNGPARTPDGALLALGNRWGQAEHATLYRTEQSWLQMLVNGRCGLTAPSPKHDSTLSVAVEPAMLEPATRYEARLVPMLLHDDFSRYPAGSAASGPDGGLGRWHVSDVDSARPSSWSVVSEGAPVAYHLRQTAVTTSTLLAYPAASDEPPWTDYRLGGYLRPPEGGATGFVFRHGDAGHYRFVMDAAGHSRRLERVTGTGTSVLAASAADYATDRDYLVTVEAIGPDLRVFEDGEPVLAAGDATLTEGRPGLYCVVAGDTAPARYTDVRVNDYRTTAPVGYRFTFTTSQFTDFHHHLHSYDDGAERVELDPAAPVANWCARAGTPAERPAHGEAQGYAALERAVGRAPAGTAVRVTRVERGSRTVALLVRGPEPLDWSRVEIGVSRAEPSGPVASTTPAEVKITDVTTGGVTLLLRDGVDLTGYRLEYRRRDDDRWLAYHEFTARRRMPAGTRVRVPGSAETPVRLCDGAALRLVRGDRVVHERRVYPAEAFVPVTRARLLRGADGYGFAVVVPDGSSLPPGRYRLDCVYRRDNRAVDPDSPVLTRGGDATPERVSLTIPA